MPNPVWVEEEDDDDLLSSRTRLLRRGTTRLGESESKTNLEPCLRDIIGTETRELPITASQAPLVGSTSPGKENNNNWLDTSGVVADSWVSLKFDTSDARLAELLTAPATLGSNAWSRPYWRCR